VITIIKEEVIRQRAPDYDLEVTSDEIDDRLWNNARGENKTISESEFNVWYRNELNVTQLSDVEYRELTETYMLREQLEEYLRANVPTEIEQVHLYVIFLYSGEDANAALDRIAEGEDFSELAQEISVDEESAEQGGDIGWWPYLGGLPENLEYWAFSLEVGQVSDVIGLDEEGQIYAICMVVERQSDREIEEVKLENIKNNIYRVWMNNELDTVNHEIFLDSETTTWINWKLAQN
jgi:parvulin-like peptidyl-prolyl isomerase